MATLQQRKLIKAIVENLGRKNSKKTLKSLLKEAGYSDAIAKNPYQIFKSEVIKEGLEPIIKDLEIQRQKAIKRMNATVSKAKYRDAVDAVDKLTKNIQLLSDKPTENIKGYLTEEQTSELKKNIK